jgi:glycosyltransferase involved in cell wall biosynthesis
MKVCQLCAVDFTLKRFLLPLIDGMTEVGWEVTAVCSDGKEISGLRNQGYRIHTLPVSRSLNPFSALVTYIKLTAFLKRNAFDLLHVHTPVAAFIGRIAAKTVGIPLVIYTAHGFYFHDQMPRWKRSFFVILERICGRFTDLLFCQSQEDAQAAIFECIVPACRVYAIGNGVNKKRFDPSVVGPCHILRSDLGIPIDAYVVGLIARQVREKGICDFLQAMSTLANRYANVWVLLVGERLPSDHDTGVEDHFASAQISLGSRLISLGSREDIPELLSVMDLFCLPSFREGMPRTIIEAMMMAKPVVSTYIRGVREEVLPEVTGLLVPTSSPDLLALAIERFLCNPTWGNLLGQSGRQRALNLYDEDHVVARQIKTITQFISNDPR